MLRQEKIEFGKRVQEKVTSFDSSILCSYTSFSTPKINALRLSVRRNGGYMQVMPNKVWAKVIEDSQLNYMIPHLKGSNFLICFNGANIVSLASNFNKEIRANKQNIHLKHVSVNGTEISQELFAQISSLKTDEQLQKLFINSLMITVQYMILMLAKPYRSIAIAMENYYKSIEGKE